ncbi:MAG: DUF177 domain-containing protein [Rikenellaceae bacterium]
MAKRSKYSINYSALADGKHSLKFDYADDLFDFADGEEIEGGRGSVTIELTKRNNLMELEVEIAGTVRTQCDRCLEYYNQEVHYNGEVLVKVTYEEGEYDGDIIWLSPSENELDLKQWLYESVVLSLPLQRVHSELSDCDPEALQYITTAHEE